MMTLAYAPHCLHAYFDNLPRGLGFDREPGYICVRLFRLVIELGR